MTGGQYRLLPTLARCCGLQRPALLSFGRQEGVFPVRFLTCSATDHTVTFRVMKDTESVSNLKPNEDCTLVFSDCGRTWIFTARLVEVALSGGRICLNLSLPTQLIPLESRRWQRIPVMPEVLDVEISGQEQTWHPDAVDLSPAAILTRFPPGEAPPTGYLANLLVRLATKGHRVRLNGFAEQRGDGLFVIYFSDILRGLRHRTLELPNELREILSDLGFDQTNAAL